MDSNDPGRSLGALTDDLKQQLGAALGKGNIPHFIQDDQVKAGPALQNPPQQVLLLSFNQFVNQSRGGNKASPSLLATGGDAQAGGQMGFAAAIRMPS